MQTLKPNMTAAELCAALTAYTNPSEHHCSRSQAIAIIMCAATERDAARAESAAWEVKAQEEGERADGEYKRGYRHGHHDADAKYEAGVILADKVARIAELEAEIKRLENAAIIDSTRSHG